MNLSLVELILNKACQLFLKKLFQKKHHNLTHKITQSLSLPHQIFDHRKKRESNNLDNRQEQ